MSVSNNAFVRPRDVLVEPASAWSAKRNDLCSGHWLRMGQSMAPAGPRFGRARFATIRHKNRYKRSAVVT